MSEKSDCLYCVFVVIAAVATAVASCVLSGEADGA